MNLSEDAINTWTNVSHARIIATTRISNNLLPPHQLLLTLHPIIIFITKVNQMHIF